jgi:hypothetical protein
MVVAFLARLSGAQLGWLLLLPALWLSARDCLASRPVAQTRALPQT